MTKITNNHVHIDLQNPHLQPELKRYKTVPVRSLNDEYIHQHKKNGLFERLYNQIKNLTNLGTGSKKVENAIHDAENGKISEKQAIKTINEYRKSQANSEQAFGDILSIGAAGFSFFKIRNLLKNKGAEALVNKNYYENIKDKIRIDKKMHKFLLKFGESKTKATMFGVGIAALAGAITKYWSLKINRIGSEEFKCNKKDFNGAKTHYDKLI